MISDEETFPSTIDLEMAIDRYLATLFIEKNASVLMKHPTPHKKAVIPFLYTPEYIIGGLAKYSINFKLATSKSIQIIKSKICDMFVMKI